MCLIIACPPGKTPDMDVIIDATIENPDGSGWCMRVNGGMDSVRSAHSIDHVIGSFYQAREANPNAWAVWHSRLATQGNLVDENTHPFQVPGKPWMLVHNGIMPLSDGPRTGGWAGRSDSRIFAEDHISEFSWEEMLAKQANIEQWLGYNKVVILSERREKHGPCLILNADKGLWDSEDGCWYSHSVDKTICNACNKRSVRCDCPSNSWSKYRRYGGGTKSVGTWDAWDDEADGWPTKSVVKAYDVSGNEIVDAEEEVDTAEWWATQDLDTRYAVGSTIHHEGDIDCDCLDCEELRYWEEKERDDNEDIAELFVRRHATSTEELIALDR